MFRRITSDPEYQATAALDQLRRTDYGRLDASAGAYLDYTGAGLHADSQVRAHVALLEHQVLGNPHSANPASSAATTLVERARGAVLSYFSADPARYTAIFTANATAALKLVGESYPFNEAGCLLLATDNHNSVNGIREFAAARGATVEYSPLALPDLRLDADELRTRLEAGAPQAPRLFAYPAQSNFSGVKHPLEFVAEAHRHGWDVLLDAAAYVPTNRLLLSAIDPEFVTISFYKMFGYPTGVGCLIVKRDALARLRRPWFAGGTVNFATVRGRHAVLSAGEAGFEDGTLNFLSLPAVEIGLAHLQRIGIDLVTRRVTCLTRHLLAALLDLRHRNGRPMVRIYGPTTTVMRGGTITFNCYDPEGRLLDYRRIEELAGERGLSLRTGCFCNPGTGETAEGLTDDDMNAAASLGPDISLRRFMTLMQDRQTGRGAGAIRASLGLVSNARDIERFVEFVASLRDQSRLTVGAVTFDIESCRVIRDGS